MQVPAGVVTKYLAGTSSLALARAYQVSKQTILRWLKAKQAPRRSLSQALRRYPLREDAFSRVTTEEQAYWLGFLLADGNISAAGRNNRAKNLRCALQARDRMHLVKLERWLGTTRPLRHDKRTNADWLTITSKQLVIDLESLGWHAFKRAGDIRILDNVPRRLQKHLVRGLVDGDGSIKFCGGRWELCFVDLHASVVVWFRDWVSTRCRAGQPKLLRLSRASVVNFTGNLQVPRILDVLYSGCTIALDRKLARATKAIRFRQPAPAVA